MCRESDSFVTCQPHRKFNAGVIDSGGKLSLALSTPMANLPQVSHQIYINLGENETKKPSLNLPPVTVPLLSLTP
jgi:hypothetical protein